jgi:all-trans-retinol dehydrogenase (NAD+)
LADRFAELGAQLVIWDVSDELLAKAQKELGAVTSVRVAKVDVSNREAVYEAARQVGAIDILVNNAGIFNGKEFLELTDVQLERIVKINQLASYWTIRAFLPGMIDRNHGHLVCTCSQAGRTGTGNLADYSSTKHALTGLMESLHLELRKQKVNIKITTVFPYFARTTLFDTDSFLGTGFPVMTPEFVADEMIDGIVRGIPTVDIPKALRWFSLLRLFPYHIQLGILEGSISTPMFGMMTKMIK